MKVVILGCGRVGASVARALDSENEVTVVDWNPHAFDRLGQVFAGDTVLGNGIDIDTLRAAGTAEADVFVALTEGDDRNLMAGQVARQLGVERVIVRVYDPVRASIFGDLNLVTYCPTTRSANRLFDMLVGAGEEA